MIWPSLQGAPQPQLMFSDVLTQLVVFRRAHLLTTSRSEVFVVPALPSEKPPSLNVLHANMLTGSA